MGWRRGISGSVFPLQGWQEKMPRLWHELPCEIGNVFWEGTCAFISLVVSQGVGGNHFAKTIYLHIKQLLDSHGEMPLVCTPQVP